jgi:hypothetical protein
MQHSSLTLSLTSTLLVGLLLSGTALAGKQFREGHILVKGAAGLSEEKFDKVLKKANPKAKSKRKLHKLPVHVVEVPAKAEEAMVRMLSRHPHIAFAELDELIAPTETPNDPRYSSQWHLPKMAAPLAWATGDGTGITVAVLDTGVNGNHEDLFGRVLPGRNVVSNNSDTTDNHGHGTKVSGVIAARTNNGIGVASVAPGAKILPIKISNASDGVAYYSDMVDGIVWAADNGARVANLSYGAAGSSSVADAADYMMGKGGVVVLAAGNYNRDRGYGNYASLFVASATGTSDTRASYSDYGSYVDIAAPGSGIYTTNTSGSYSSVSGTSFASPNTAAVAALVMSANPGLLPTDVMAVIINSSVDLGDASWDPFYGHGRVDALAAVELAAGVENSDNTPPQAVFIDPSANAEVSGVVGVNVQASDDFGMSHVELLVDGVPFATANAGDANNTYTFAWDSTRAANGQHRFSARAVDTSGNVGNAEDILVQVANTIEDNPPTVAIISPGDGSSGSRSVTLMASANDDKGPPQVSIYADGKLRCAASGTVSCSWNLRKVAPGTYTVSATAQDSAGNTDTKSVNFIVEGSSGSTKDNTNKGGGKGRSK